MPAGFTMDQRTWILIRVKILCYLVLYVLALMLIVSLLSRGTARAFGALDTPKWAVYFGLYLVATGISTAGIASLRGRMDAPSRARQFPGATLDEIARSQRAGHIASGTVFVLMGGAFLISALGCSHGWWPHREVFSSTAARVVLLFTLNFPMMVGSYVINWSNFQKGYERHFGGGDRE